MNKPVQKLTTGPSSVVRKKDIAIVQAALEDIERRHGKLTPRLVVQEVKRNRKSVLAQYFDDPMTAAMNWWIEQARSLIQSVYVTVDSLPPIRKWTTVTVVTPEKLGPQHIYVDTLEALDNDRFREQTLNQAQAEIVTWRRKYETYRKYCSWIDSLSRSIDRAIKHRKKIGHGRRQTSK